MGTRLLASVAVLVVGGAALGGCGDAGSGGTPAPKASSITGTIVPPTNVVGQPVTITFDLSGFNRDIKVLALNFDGDLHDHHTIDGVTITLDGGSPTDCQTDPNDSKYYDCGSVKKAQKAEVVIIAVPKDAGNFKPNVLFIDGILGSGSFQAFEGDNSVMGFKETVNP